jgi:osmotically-inducible protein OsmY
MNRKGDSEIKLQILRELKWDSDIGWSASGVEVMEGVVTLTGMVSSYLATAKSAGWGFEESK